MLRRFLKSGGASFVKLCFKHGKAANRAIFYAFSAADAFFIINGCKEVFNFDCFCGAVLLAFHAADTAVLAFFANNSAFFMVRAGDDRFFSFRYDRNKVVGAFCNAKSATGAFSGVNFCNAVYNADCIVFANGCAVAAAKASEKAGAFSAVKHFCGNAGVESLINFFLNLFVTIAAAMYESGNGLCSLGFNTEDFADCFYGCFTAGAAKVCGSFGVFGKSFCVSITTGKTAGSAVCTGKAVANFAFDRVYFNTHEMGRKDKKKGTCKADSSYNKCSGNNNISHL